MLMTLGQTGIVIQNSDVVESKLSSSGPCHAEHANVESMPQGDRAPVIRAMHNVGFPSIFDHRRSQHETKAIYRREDHLDPQRA